MLPEAPPTSWIDLMAIVLCLCYALVHCSVVG